MDPSEGRQLIMKVYQVAQ